jgi:hypothetical protein
MARCDVPGCDWYGKAAGKAIHMAKAHDIHPEHEDVGDGESWAIKATIVTVGEDGPLVGATEIPIPSSLKKPDQDKPDKDPLDQLIDELEERWANERGEVPREHPAGDTEE